MLKKITLTTCLALTSVVSAQAVTPFMIYFSQVMDAGQAIKMPVDAHAAQFGLSDVTIIPEQKL